MPVRNPRPRRERASPREVAKSREEPNNESVQFRPGAAAVARRRGPGSEGDRVRRVLPGEAVAAGIAEGGSAGAPIAEGRGCFPGKHPPGRSSGAAGRPNRSPRANRTPNARILHRAPEPEGRGRARRPPATTWPGPSPRAADASSSSTPTRRRASPRASGGRTPCGHCPARRRSPPCSTTASRPSRTSSSARPISPASTSSRARNT